VFSFIPAVDSYPVGFVVVFVGWCSRV